MDAINLLFAVAILAIIVIPGYIVYELTSNHRRRRKGIMNNKDLIIEIIHKAMQNTELYSDKDMVELQKELEFASKFFKIRTNARKRRRSKQGIVLIEGQRKGGML